MTVLVRCLWCLSVTFLQIYTQLLLSTCLSSLLSLSLSSPTIYLSISFFPFLSTFFHCCTKVSFSFSYIYMLIDEMKNARVLVEETQMPETLGDDDIVQGTPPRIVRSLDFSV